METLLNILNGLHPDVDFASIDDLYDVGVLDSLDMEEAYRVSPYKLFLERRALQETISRKMGGDERSTLEIMAEIIELLKNDKIW